MLRKIIALIGTVALTHSFAAVTLSVSPSHPSLLAKDKQTTMVEIRIAGVQPPVNEKHRLPVNMSIVLDRSGSMDGDRLEQAKEAARTVIGMLGPNDIISLISYSDEAETVVSATKLNERADVLRAIDNIESSGNTALFAGVSKGLSEVRKFKDRQHVNRVVLLSDGMANVGPSSTAELASLGRSAGRDGISVTTIGLGEGYNEDLMSQLALSSDGNHAFAANSEDIAGIFQRELGSTFSVVAQSIQVNIICPAGVKPIRVLDQDAEVRGQNVTLSFNQIYGQQNKSLLLEVEVAGKEKGSRMDLAQVAVNYDDPSSGRREALQGSAGVQFTADIAVVRRDVNKDAIIQASKARVNMVSKQAMEMRDKGNYAGAKAIMDDNAQQLQSQASELNIPQLRDESQVIEDEKKVLAAPAPAAVYNVQRKAMKAKQAERSSQYSIQDSSER